MKNEPRSKKPWPGRNSLRNKLVGHMTIRQALANRKVLALAAAYFFVVTGSYGVEFYMASILEDWYGMTKQTIAYLVIIPAIGALIGQRLVGWNSDRTHERRWHASLPIIMGAAALVLAPDTKGYHLAHDDDLHHRDDRRESLSAGILGAAQSLPDRVGRRRLDRADQLVRQPGRMDGPHRARRRQAGHGQLPLRPVVPEQASVIVSALIIASLGIGGKSPPVVVDIAPELE